MPLNAAHLAALRAHIDATPALASQPMTPDGADAIAEALNATSGTAPRERLVSARTVLAEVGPAGAVILDKLQSFTDGPKPGNPSVASVHAAARWTIRYVMSADGIDVGHPRTRAMLDSMASAGIVTQAEADAIKALALQPQTVAEALLAPWTGRVTYQDVQAARSR